MQAAGGIISAALLSTPGASRFYQGGLTVCGFLVPVVSDGWMDIDGGGGERDVEGGCGE